MAFNYTFVFKLKIMIHFKIDEFFDTNSIGKAAELFEKMSEERFFVKHIGLSYRVINSWDEKGLIRCSRKKEGGDRKFSFADFSSLDFRISKSVLTVLKIHRPCRELVEPEDLFCRDENLAPSSRTSPVPDPQILEN